MFPRAQIPAIATAVVEACDARDGVKDGIVDNPPVCRFKAASLRCTRRRDRLVSHRYAGGGAAEDLRRSADIERPADLPGIACAAASWVPAAGRCGSRARGPALSLQSLFSAQGAPNLLHQDAAYTVQSFDVDHAPPTAGQRRARPGSWTLTIRNLAAFKRRGGKLIIYHGWSDPALSASATIDYYASVSARMGAKETSDFARLYLVPGMQHCNGGPGPNQFGIWPVKGADSRTSVSAALERWVEDGVAPVRDHCDASRRPARSRPLCAYPQIARYKGRGSADDAANFECRNP